MRTPMLIFLAFLFIPGTLGLEVRFNFPIGTQDAVIEVPDNASAYDAFAFAASQLNFQLDTQWFDFDGDGVAESAFINGINGVATSDDFTSYWQFAIDNEPSFVGMSDYEPDDDDILSLDYLEGEVTDAYEWIVDGQAEDGKLGPNSFQHGIALTALALGDLASPVDDGFAALTEPADSLARAIALLATASNERPADALATSLLAEQRPDGGWRSGTDTSDTDTTAWAMIALAAAGRQVPEDATAYLLSSRTDDAWGYQQGNAPTIDFTAEALIALAAAHVPVEDVDDALSWLRDEHDDDGCYADGYRTAIAAIALTAYDDADAPLVRECLATLDNADGSFGRSSNTANPLDTALALIALSGRTLPLEQPAAGSIGLHSTVQFTVEIENSGTIDAQDVRVTLHGIDPAWIREESETEIGLLPAGEKRTLTVYAAVERAGDYDVYATVTTATSGTTITSNILTLNVIEAFLHAVLALA